MELRLGEILVSQGVLSEHQVEQVLEQQRQNQRPFGVLCEELFGTDPHAIEDAWSHQYAGFARVIDPNAEVFDPAALELLTRRQAWQFRTLPIRFDNGELMLATTRMHLCRALRFATITLGVPLYFVLAQPDSLGDALCRHYRLPGMTPASVNDHAMDHLFTSLNAAPPC